MSWSTYNIDLVPFPTPDRNRDVYYPSSYLDNSSALYDQRAKRPLRRKQREDSLGSRDFARLCDKTIDYHGDLGWTVEYATAWCYKHLLGNRPEVADAIDRVRELQDVLPETPFMIFDYLDKALFAGKLKDMVYLRWTCQASSSPGITSAPGVVKGISRICIELNRTPFEERVTDIDDLLNALVHQMIHAWFLVACGAQPKGAKQDGRLMDGLHFGVIMLTICDICLDCRDGPLELTFYSMKRRRQYSGTLSYGPSCSPHSYISIDARGDVIGAAAADGQSHCNHDNCKIRVADIRNWQVQSYSIAMELEMEAKGDIVYDLDIDQKLVPIDRLKGPPSSTYVELIWNEKRIMISREKALAFSSIKKPLEKHSKMELKIPECDLEVFSCVYDFINKSVFAPGARELSREVTDTESTANGPPILAHHSTGHAQKLNGIITFIKVFHVAESLKFEELLRYALERLYDLPITYDDPIVALKELYEGKTSVHAELHRWVRKFLVRRDTSLSSHDTLWNRHSVSGGTTNYEKLLNWYGTRFEQLHQRCAALRDDCKIVVAELALSGMYNSMAEPSKLPPRGALAYPPRMIHDSYLHSQAWSPLESLEYVGSPVRAPLPGPLIALQGIHGVTSMGRRLPLEWMSEGRAMPSPNFRTNATYSVYDEDGRLKISNLPIDYQWMREL